MKFVLDNLVVMRWLLKNGSPERLAYAGRVLEHMEQGASASVPQIWPLEVGNVLLKAQARRLVNEAQGSAFVGLLQDALIKTDMQTQTHALSDTLHLAHRFGLSTCDACYLKLALRENMKLATLDHDLRAACEKLDCLWV